VRTTPDRVLVVAGFAQGLTLVCRTLRDRGVTRIAVEDPCFSYHRHLIAAAGLSPVPVPVDDDGIEVSRLGDLGVGAVLLAPAHSYPAGAALSSDRRIQLLDWARANDTLVVEDDYDAEFRYDRTPIGALQGLAPDHVVYGGSVSKVLTPAIRIGWLVVPEWLIGDLLRAKFLDDLATETLGQLALARFIDGGDLSRHLRRVRPVYRARRDTLLDALATFLPDATPTGVAAGLHLYVRLPASCPEQELVEEAGHRGVHVEGAARHWADPDHRPPALVLGYGTLHRTSIRHALATLGAAYDRLRRPAGRPPPRPR
jgi:GntR family transcriptional regulator/MocR family aminotransferase